MGLKERLKIFKDRGYIYDPINGNIISKRGRICKAISGGKYISCSCVYEKKQISIKAHVLGWYLYYNEVPSKQIDHINRIKTDNRICNLRLVTVQQNQFNTNARGYYWNKKYKYYQAYITLGGKRIHLGFFNKEEDARQAYINAKKIYHII